MRETFSDSLLGLKNKKKDNAFDHLYFRSGGHFKLKKKES